MEGLRSAETPCTRPAAAGEESVFGFTGVGVGVGIGVGVGVGVLGLLGGDDSELSWPWDEMSDDDGWCWLLLSILLLPLLLLLWL